MQMALGSRISVSTGESSGDTVHVNNQPIIVLLVLFRKGDALGVGLCWGHTCFTSTLSWMLQIKLLVF